MAETVCADESFDGIIHSIYALSGTTKVRFGEEPELIHIPKQVRDRVTLYGPIGSHSFIKLSNTQNSFTGLEPNEQQPHRAS